MKGKEFGDKYLDLLDDDNNYDSCIELLERQNDDWVTDNSVHAIKEAQQKVKNEIKEMEDYNVIKE